MTLWLRHHGTKNRIVIMLLIYIAPPPPNTSKRCPGHSLNNNSPALVNLLGIHQCLQTGVPPQAFILINPPRVHQDLLLFWNAVDYIASSTAFSSPV